jgi:hypothetical protein
MPSFADTALSLGYDDLDNVYQDAVLFQQGRETEITEAEPGDEFEVPFALNFNMNFGQLG